MEYFELTRLLLGCDSGVARRLLGGGIRQSFNLRKNKTRKRKMRNDEEIPIQNPVYLMLGASFGSSAKGTGLKALEFALSVCDTVDMYGFTVDPGYKEWTRYFSESRQGSGLGILSCGLTLGNCMEYNDDEDDDFEGSGVDFSSNCCFDGDDFPVREKLNDPCRLTHNRRHCSNFLRIELPKTVYKHVSHPNVR
ncbi:hypothetical protein KSP39_PZI007875 [Platanthera zijinensis]|uniref:Uncharacterized protein n=1 Tax=Platanthera zijinensis TaxID=2320716 RepID=A0AAP0G868_9ASPA